MLWELNAADRERFEGLFCRVKRRICKSIMNQTRMKAHQMSHNTNGLLYRYGNKSRRKVSHVLILLAVLAMPLMCDGEDKIVRVDPLGKLHSEFMRGHDCWQDYIAEAILFIKFSQPDSVFFLFTNKLFTQAIAFHELWLKPQTTGFHFACYKH